MDGLVTKISNVNCRVIFLLAFVLGVSSSWSALLAMVQDQSGSGDSNLHINSEISDLPKYEGGYEFSGGKSINNESFLVYFSLPSSFAIEDFEFSSYVDSDVNPDEISFIQSGLSQMTDEEARTLGLSGEVGGQAVQYYSFVTTVVGHPKSDLAIDADIFFSLEGRNADPYQDNSVRAYFFLATGGDGGSLIGSGLQSTVGGTAASEGAPGACSLSAGENSKNLYVILFMVIGLSILLFRKKTNRGIQS